MSDFEFDCMKKKQLAGQAKYRKRGSKSKKCSLPSDGMTNKQWKERCGPVVSFNFSKPISWEDFKKLPTNIQAEYIVNLQQKYGATAVDFGNMFGVKSLTVRRHAEANRLDVDFPRGHSMSYAQRVEWDKFLSCLDEDIRTDEADGCKPDCDQPKNVSSDDSDIGKQSMRMENFRLVFSGAIDISMIANSLKWILGESPNGEIEIICNLQ